jgi:hypothetical protein
MGRDPAWFSVGDAEKLSIRSTQLSCGPVSKTCVLQLDDGTFSYHRHSGESRKSSFLAALGPNPRAHWMLG